MKKTGTYPGDFIGGKYVQVFETGEFIKEDRFAMNKDEGRQHTLCPEVSLPINSTIVSQVIYSFPCILAIF